MKKVVFIPLILLSLNISAEWVFVDESKGVLGVGKDSELYVWKYYETDDSGMRNFKILTNFKRTIANEASSVADWGVFCDRPHRVFITNLEGFSEKNAKGRSVYIEENIATWMSLNDDSTLRVAVNMVCKN